MDHVLILNLIMISVLLVLTTMTTVKYMIERIVSVLSVVILLKILYLVLWILNLSSYTNTMSVIFQILSFVLNIVKPLLDHYVNSVKMVKY